jgi:transcriptional regulator with XRE-family HTH domain
MAEVTGLTVEAVSRIERATREPRIGTLYRFTRGLRLRLSEVMDFDLQHPTRIHHRADVEVIALLLDDKPPSTVAKLKAILELVFDEP